MFNPEHSIAEWRNQMLAAGIKTPVPLEELESHLRDEFERQTNTGLSGAEAFVAAIREIGSAQAVQNEFMKIEKIPSGRNWKPFEIFFLASALAIPLCVAAKAFVFRSDSFLEMTFVQQLSIQAAAITFSLLAWIMRFRHGKYPVIRTNSIRDAIFIPVLILVLASIVILPRWDFSHAQRAVVSMWAFAPFGILIGWCWGYAHDPQSKAVGAGS